MRLFLAALFVLLGMTLVIGWFSDLIENASPIVLVLLAVVIAVVFLGLSGVAFMVFNGGLALVVDRQTRDALVRELEEADLLTATRYRANRAVAVGDAAGEDCRVLVELMGGDILHLSGDYLDEYTLGAEDGAMHGFGPGFPSTEFVIRRHRTEGYVVDVLCLGRAIEMDRATIRTEAVVAVLGDEVGDGDVIRDWPYDELLGYFLAAR